MPLSSEQKKDKTRRYMKHYGKKYREENAEKIRRQNRDHYRRARTKALTHYSDASKPRCACCKETELHFLCLDHIEGVKEEHKINGRRRRSGSPLYSWLVKNDYPSGFQVLCHNCNMAKGFYGQCPHMIQ